MTPSQWVELAFEGVQTVNKKICHLAQFILPDSTFALLIVADKSR